MVPPKVDKHIAQSAYFRQLRKGPVLGRPRPNLEQHGSISGTPSLNRARNLGSGCVEFRNVDDNECAPSDSPWRIFIHHHKMYVADYVVWRPSERLSGANRTGAMEDSTYEENHRQAPTVEKCRC